MQTFKNLLKDVITFGNSFSSMTFVGQLATAAILIFTSYQLTSCEKNKQLDNIKIAAERTSEHARKITDSLHVLNDSVAKKEVIIDKLTVEISLRSRMRTVFRSEERRLQILRDTVTDTVQLVAVQDTTIDNLKTQLSIVDTILTKQVSVIAQKDTVIDMLKTGLELSETKADTLQKTLDATIKKMNKKDKFFGFIPFPSRKTVGIIGLVGGVYLGTQLTK
jgi:hypothetical protein